MTDTAIILGRGESLQDWDWSTDAPIYAISGAINCCKRKPEHWVALDQARYYPQWPLLDETIRKHQQDTAERRSDAWGDPERCRNIQWWDVRNAHTDELDLPNLSDADRPIVPRAQWMLYSMMAAIQIAHLSGHRRLVFVGCDLHLSHYWPIIMTLKKWHARATSLGLEWINASERSRLSEFVPTLNGSTV